MSKMNAEQLADWLSRNIAEYMPQGIRFQAENVHVKYVFNWGGFANHSFTVTDGLASYHLKITSEEHRVQRLKNWWEFSDILEHRYRAPKLVAWMDFAPIGFAGLLMKHEKGTFGEFSKHPDLAHALVTLALQLHHDADIRSRLCSNTSGKTYCDHFVETYIDRFTSDLAAIEADRPAFVSTELLRWMTDETERLRETAKATAAFNAASIEPVHGDLHEYNLLVTRDKWFIIDWDDLSLGDPAVEFAVLLWPMIYRGLPWRHLLPSTDDRFTERMELCLKAQLLDEVIDTLADYVEAPALVPVIAEEVRIAKKKRHEEALERYRSQRTSQKG